MIEAAPGLFFNGQITVGENAADLGGIQALQARLSADDDYSATPLADGEVVVEPPFTPEQQFFIAAASVWCNKTRPALLALLVHGDVHAPEIVRATQPLRNSAPFFTASGIESGTPCACRQITALSSGEHRATALWGRLTHPYMSLELAVRRCTGRSALREMASANVMNRRRGSSPRGLG